MGWQASFHRHWYSVHFSELEILHLWLLREVLRLAALAPFEAQGKQDRFPFGNLVNINTPLPYVFCKC